MAVKLTLGPVLFNWTPEKWRDFYFQIADEAPVDIVYVGEVVCSKRMPFFAEVFPDVLDRLKKAGKEIVFSSLAMVMNKREAGAMRELAEDKTFIIEANDISALPPLQGRDHVIGPYINVYNEETLKYLAQHGARRFCLSPEIPFAAVEILTEEGKKHKAEVEVQVFGRMPLALSARCYHARAHKLTKDNCRFVCGKDPDGMMLKTLDDQPFLAVNGIQTLSDGYLNLADKMGEMQTVGVNHFRLSPQDCDMVQVARYYRNVADGKTVSQKIEKILPKIHFLNGYYDGREGHRWVGRYAPADAI
jgi:collagenase-like PrtC family protease